MGSARQCSRTASSAASTLSMPSALLAASAAGPMLRPATSAVTGPPSSCAALKACRLVGDSLPCLCSASTRLLTCRRPTGEGAVRSAQAPGQSPSFAAHPAPEATYRSAKLGRVVPQSLPEQRCAGAGQHGCGCPKGARLQWDATPTPCRQPCALRVRKEAGVLRCQRHLKASNVGCQGRCCKVSSVFLSRETIFRLRATASGGVQPS